jgi:hypothetical protein
LPTGAFVGPCRFFNGVDIAGRYRKACVPHKNSDEKRGAALRLFNRARLRSRQRRHAKIVAPRKETSI